MESEEIQEFVPDRIIVPHTVDQIMGALEAGGEQVQYLVYLKLAIKFGVMQ